MDVIERKKIGRIRAVSCRRNRVVESDEQREIRKSVNMAKDTGIVTACKRKRMVGLSKLGESDAEDEKRTERDRYACCKFSRESVADLLLRPIVVCHIGYMDAFREIGDIIRLHPLSRCDDQRPTKRMMIVSAARRRVT
jgi:hypothetical protein